MAKAGANKPAKPTREQKKVARSAKREQRRQTRRNLRDAFTLTRTEDARFIPYLVLAIVVPAAVAFVVVLLLLSWLEAIPFALLAGAVGGMLVFSRRAQRVGFAKAEGKPGAAAQMLQSQLRGDWHKEEAVAGTAQLDFVHRLIGRPGVILIGEGVPHRVHALIAQEKKRIKRVVGETPIYDVVVGPGEGQVPLRKLNLYVNKLPRNLSKAEVATLEKRVSALGVRRAPLPQGPMPPGAKMRNVQRATRRRS
jgi:Domain of unknown function (DUF4191)